MRTPYFALLSLETLVIAMLAGALYRRTRDASVWVGTAALYYWTLYGAWSVVIDKSGGSSGKNYHYLETKLFPVLLGGYYMETLVLYSLFVAAVLVTVLLLTPSRHANLTSQLNLNHGPILLIATIAGLASFLLIRTKLSAAWAQNTSAYWYTRTDTGPWFTLHQILNRVALIPPAIGFASLLAGQRSRYFTSRRNSLATVGYLVLFAAMGLFTFLLGNKNEVLVALLAGLFCYVNSLPSPRYVRAGLAALSGFWFLYVIDFFRAVPLSAMRSTVVARLTEATEVFRFAGSSNEAYAAHFSLYGVLAGHVAPKFGYSIYALLCSIVPRALWPNRPLDIYFYYSDAVGAIPNQGYSLHHATGWYLNFGISGILLGAVVLGGVWAACIRSQSSVEQRLGASKVFAIIAPWLFVAYLPPLIRAGPEGYKGWILEAVLIPVAVLTLSSKPVQNAAIGLRPHSIPGR